MRQDKEICLEGLDSENYLERPVNTRKCGKASNELDRGNHL